MVPCILKRVVISDKMRFGTHESLSRSSLVLVRTFFYGGSVLRYSYKRANPGLAVEN